MDCKKYCPICSSQEISFHSTHNDRRKGLKGEWEVYECSDCGVFFINPLPTADEINYFYSNYYNEKTTAIINLGRGDKFPFLLKLYHMLTGDQDPRDAIQDYEGKKILDYGCGSSGLFRHFIDKAEKSIGAEISEITVNKYKSLGIEVEQVLEINKIPFGDNLFDIVYLMQVLEHIKDPHIFFRELNRILMIDGFLYLSIPNSKSSWRKVFRNNWVSGWFSPFHIYNYNVSVIRTLACKYGFNLVEYNCSTPYSWLVLNLKSVLYESSVNIEKKSFIWLEKYPFKLVFMFIFRFFDLCVPEKDCLMIKLQKKNDNIV